MPRKTTEKLFEDFDRLINERNAAAKHLKALEKKVKIAEEKWHNSVMHDLRKHADECGAG